MVVVVVAAAVVVVLVVLLSVVIRVKRMMKEGVLQLFFKVN